MKHLKYEKLSVFLRDRAGLLLYYLLNNPSAYSWKTGLLQKYCRILDSYLLILICNLFNRRYSKRKYVSSSGNNSYLDEEGGGGIREWLADHLVGNRKTKWQLYTQPQNFRHLNPIQFKVRRGQFVIWKRKKESKEEKTKEKKRRRRK